MIHLTLPSADAIERADALRARQRVQAVYDRLHAVLNRLGRDGEITTRDDCVTQLMAALAEFDGGTYDPNIAVRL